MEYTGTKLMKWQKIIVDDSVKLAVKFIKNKYNIDESLFDLVTIHFSNTCRFAKYKSGYGVIRINLKDKDVLLYDKKSLGSYNTQIRNVGYKISWTCQIIHELTHFIQDLENRCFSEVETTQNELEYLREYDII